MILSASPAPGFPVMRWPPPSMVPPPVNFTLDTLLPKNTASWKWLWPKSWNAELEFDSGASYPLADAVSAPLFHHQALPDTIRIERGGFQSAVLDSLRAMGHEVAPSTGWGDIEAIIRTATGWQGVSDPRRGGGGAGY